MAHLKAIGAAIADKEGLMQHPSQDPHAHIDREPRLTPTASESGRAIAHIAKQGPYAWDAHKWAMLQLYGRQDAYRYY